MRNMGQLVLIAVGSNADSVWGDATSTMREATSRVAALSREPSEISRFYQTPAFPAGNGPDFVNAAMAIRTCSSPHKLLAQLHEIEAQAGRVRHERWGPRTLDLDLLAVGDAILPDGPTHQTWRDLTLADQQSLTPTDLILPHPRLQDRAFVLVPLRDIAPNWQHPILNRTVDQMIAELDPQSVAEVVPLRP